jgi:hypothetical protein
MKKGSGDAAYVTQRCWSLLHRRVAGNAGGLCSISGAGVLRGESLRSWHSAPACSGQQGAIAASSAEEVHETAGWIKQADLPYQMPCRYVQLGVPGTT